MAVRSTIRASRRQSGGNVYVSTLLRRCLQKDRGERLRDIADARLELKEGSASVRLPAARPRVVPWLTAALSCGRSGAGADPFPRDACGAAGGETAAAAAGEDELQRDSGVPGRTLGGVHGAGCSGQSPALVTAA
jgi:hypothetical protein